ncbi:hypothetical protein BH10PSE19_BH10PSE19_20680 [soil metagenome]
MHNHRTARTLAPLKIFQMDMITKAEGFRQALTRHSECRYKRGKIEFLHIVFDTIQESPQRMLNKVVNFIIPHLKNNYTNDITDRTLDVALIEMICQFALDNPQLINKEHLDIIRQNYPVPVPLSPTMSFVPVYIVVVHYEPMLLLPSSPYVPSPTYGPSTPTYGSLSPTYAPLSPPYGPSTPTYAPLSPPYTPSRSPSSPPSRSLAYAAPPPPMHQGESSSMFHPKPPSARRPKPSAPEVKLRYDDAKRMTLFGDSASSLSLSPATSTPPSSSSFPQDNVKNSDSQDDDLARIAKEVAMSVLEPRLS